MRILPIRDTGYFVASGGVCGIESEDPTPQEQSSTSETENLAATHLKDRLNCWQTIFD